MNYENFGCDFEISDKFTYTCAPDVRCGYPQDTIEYALRRFFRKSKNLKIKCIQESWQIRLAKGLKRKPHNHTYRIPARWLELPGIWAIVKLSVDEAGVTVHSLKLSMDSASQL